MNVNEKVYHVGMNLFTTRIRVKIKEKYNNFQIIIDIKYGIRC